MKTKYIALVLIVFILNQNSFAQLEGVCIANSSNSPDGSAMLDVQSTTKGILIPTMSIIDRNNILNPRHGLMVFVDDGTNTNDGFYYYDSNILNWIPFGGSSLWTPVGNTIENTNAGPVVINGDNLKSEILFKGTQGDDQPWDGIHTAIVERLYANTEDSELLLFKGNDPFNGNGPDRIRYDAVGGHIFQVDGTASTGGNTRNYDPTIEGTTVLSILSNQTIGIGNNPNRYRVEIPTTDQNGANNGLIHVKAIDSYDNGNPAITRNITIGNDGNEINAFLDGSSQKTSLYLNYENGNDVHIGGWHPFSPNPESDLWVQGMIECDYVYERSDRKFKKNIQPVGEALKLINAVRGIKYQNANKENKKVHYGVIAQEVEKVIPNIVLTVQPNLAKGEKQEPYKVVAYTEFIPILIEATKEQDKKITQLENEISQRQSIQEEQQNQIDNLTKQVKALEALIKRQIGKTKDGNGNHRD